MTDKSRQVAATMLSALALDARLPPPLACRLVTVLTTRYPVMRPLLERRGTGPQPIS